MDDGAAIPRETLDTYGDWRNAAVRPRRIGHEALGYFDPRPWHRDTPQRPRVWERDTTTIWGPPPTPDFHRERDTG